MVHPEVQRGYHEIRVNWPPESKGITDMFIGRFNSDGQYHLLGHRPREIAYLFSAESESNQDIGVIKLPTNKNRLSQLVAGEIFEIIPTEPPKKGEKIWTAKYIKSA